MKNRYRRFIDKDERGTTFGVRTKRSMILPSLEEEKKELIITEAEVVNNKINIESYKNPIIPEGYVHVCGNWYNGFVIERKLDKSQFVWIPVEYLDANGILNYVSLPKKFGRRKFWNWEFSEKGFYEPVVGELALQVDSVKKYGGFYISRYNISRNEENGKAQSIRGAMPWVNVDFYEAKKIADNMELSHMIKSHLTFGAEYDSLLEWLMVSKAKTEKEILWNSSEWGNYWSVSKFFNKLAKTGSDERWCVNHIYDLAGNVSEWTQEQYGKLNHVIRGGSYYKSGDCFPVVFRCSHIPDDYYEMATSFRSALYIR